MNEAAIEAKLVQGVQALGGRAYKFVSPGHPGVPDRLIVLPGGLIFFVELKTEIGRLSKMQQYEIRCLNELGAKVNVLKGLHDVKIFLQGLEVGLHEFD